MREAIQVDQKLPLLQSLPLSLQHLFAMFGANVLVPILLGIDPAIVLLFNGIGTLLYILITKKMIPVYLGASSAFIACGQLVISKYGYADALGGFIAGFDRRRDRRYWSGFRAYRRQNVRSDSRPYGPRHGFHRAVHTGRHGLRICFL